MGQYNLTLLHHLDWTHSRLSKLLMGFLSIHHNLSPHITPYNKLKGAALNYRSF